jgi:hypothetical protein
LVPIFGWDSVASKSQGLLSLHWAWGNFGEPRIWNEIP